MAKNNERVQVKKGTAKFNLVGTASVNDYTFKIDVPSQKSDWVYNQMNLSIDCGDDGKIYADMMGGYGSERQNVVYVHGKKENGQDDFKNFFTLDWDDRNDETILESVGDMCFITVGLEKDINNKTVYKKFVSQYDAIQYINDNLTDGMVVNVKGNLTYSIYNDNVQVKKDITSICLSEATEDKFKATFTQTLLLDSDSVGKVDKETLTIPIYARVVDYVKEYDGKLVKTMLPLAKTFSVKISKETIEKTNKMLKHFKAKKGTITALTIDGRFSRGEINTVTTSEDDIPDDIKDLIELGFIEKDEVLNKMALANGGGNKPEQMIITNPHIKFTGEDTKMPMIDKLTEAYSEDDLNISLIIESKSKGNQRQGNDEVEKDIDKSEEKTENQTNDVIEESEDNDDDWLNALD
ncbi:hypothetical protein IRP62_11405 (plasmid) [Clostridium botulinum]|uniref:conserved hypothetical phage-related protein n=1 Tax=Clostridium botulinum C phage TaxID=12336 RepID=UPI00005DB505|nr:hypothetical protein [Clostridium botulinum]YP_398485.1 conserved hypothetical phage-related protein [Clostridium phage c-st]MCD3216906.1 hypothetical protein [Clostridium botulinum C]MCD3245391.1 hypothetical protein [Clostridium botulinum C]MCD3261770.1 hypothetical protein [Clostridium botulinum C]QPW54400.1 hypothetical protein IRP62_11405 [Clostridium botulinum]BAE47753.1 conserved hypothetical phage-related protein [Clostridium phage c-st]